MAILTVVCGLLLLAATGAGAAVPEATLLPSGRAVAPPSAPPAVKAMIEAGNRIRHRPYRWAAATATGARAAMTARARSAT